MDSSNSITAEELRERLNYDAETGIFTWRTTRNQKYKVGAQVGSDDMYGYKTVRLSDKSYKLHRLAWLYVYGDWPSGDIDHINGDRSDNRIVNLRDVSRKTNLQNQRKAPNNKSTGMLGAYFDKSRNRFYSRISIDDKSIHLGTFKTAQEAHDAYIQAKRHLHEGCMI
jgi:hypothetical protein